MTTEPWWESRVVLTPSTPRELLHLLDRVRHHDPVQVGHQLLWTLFGDRPDRERDFLYLVERDRPFTAVVRSPRQPLDSVGCWRIEPSHRFLPALTEGMRLRFRLKAVPVTWVRHGDGEKTKRQDVIVAAWQRLPPEERRDEERRTEAAGRAIDAWLMRQGERCGFMVECASLLDYDRQRVPTSRPGERLVFGAVTLEGELTVRDTEPFGVVLRKGLGAAKGFGHGLLQIAPARDAL